MKSVALLTLAYLALCWAHDCFNCATGGECLHYAKCNNYTGICECPDGFGGANCKEPVCGSLPQGNRRALRPINSTCGCDDGWSGVNCNMCTSNSSCEAFMPSPGQHDARCYQGGLLVERNFHMCDVTNKKILDILKGRRAQVTFGCVRNTSTCDLQLWVDQIESFFCKFEECEFNGLTYDCQKIQCQCQPNELLCGKEGSIDISEWLLKDVHGPGNLKCDRQGKCMFQEPAMDQLIKFVFGDPSIELQCTTSECLHYSQVPGYELPSKPKATPFAIFWSLLLGIGVLFFLVLAFRSLSDNVDYSFKKPVRLPSEEPVARVAPVGLYFDHIKYKVTSGKEILSKISGAVPPGHVLAIMGGSGAGKTTLLDILGGKHKTGQIEGNVLLNGSPLTSHSPLRKLIGFVDQSDSALVPTQTVYEHVLFSAMLRLPRSMSQSTKEFRVLETLSELGIDHLSNQLVGKGLSGGERRRVAIACELVTSPSILLLDEPTSGLDAFNAFTVVETLVKLAKNANRTIVFTIHQPRSNIVSLFDRILLLSRGQMVYTGSVHDAEIFFKDHGYECPTNYNIADYIVDITMKASASRPYSDNVDDISGTATQDADSMMVGTLEQPIPEDVLSEISDEGDIVLEQNSIHEGGDGSVQAYSEDCPDPKVHTNPLEVDGVRQWRDYEFHRAQISRTSAQAMANSQLNLAPQGMEPLVLAFRHSLQFADIQSEINNAEDTSYLTDVFETKRASLIHQFVIISLRNFRNLYRDSMLILTHYGISACLGILCGYLYFDVSNDISGFQNRLGLFFFLLAVFGFSTLTTISLFSRERLTFMRERSNGYYHPFAFYASKVLLDIFPLRLGPPLLLGLIVYPTVGLNTAHGAPLVFLLLLTLFNLSAATIMLFIGIVVADFGVASLLGCMTNLFGILFAGLFLNQDSMPIGAGWIKYLSIYHYAYEALSVNEVKYLTLIEDKFGLKIEVPGATILSAFGFDNGAVVRDIGGLAIISVFSIIAGYIALHKVLIERR